MTWGVLVAALAGVLTWSLLEYGIHRFLGHGSGWRTNPFAKEHIRHHAEGDYFAPAHKKAVAAVAFLVVIGPLASFAVGATLGMTYTVGLVSMYLAYEVLHRRLHVSAGIGPYARWARRHHFAHHFTDARVNHGVTSPLWDLVFGTYRSPGVVKVPRRLRMEWLEDPATGDVRTEWAGDFVLRK